MTSDVMVDKQTKPLEIAFLFLTEKRRRYLDE